MEDASIVALYWKRDEAAIKETEKKYGNYLMKIARNVLSDEEDSKEAVNDTYLGAWNSMPENRPSLLSAYLGKLTREISIDIFRKRKSKKRAASEYAVSLTELSDCVSGHDDPCGEAELKELGEKISEYLLTLPDKTRDMFICRYYFMDSVKDVAGYFGAGESMVKSRLSRARAGLKDFLEKEGFTV